MLFVRTELNESIVNDFFNLCLKSPIISFDSHPSSSFLPYNANDQCPPSPGQSKKSKSPSIITANIRSTLGKLDEVQAAISSSNTSIFAACETLLHDKIQDNLIKVPRYEHFRCDRRSRVGGGVCVWVHSSLSTIQLTPQSQPDFLESVWLCFPKASLLFICVYIPPLHYITGRIAIEELFIRNADFFLAQFPDFDLIICGDLNRFVTSTIEVNLDLRNEVCEPTRGTSILDYFIISNLRSSDYSVQVTAPIANSDHKSVTATPINPIKHNMRIVRPIFDLRQSNVDHYLHLLSQINWTPFYKAKMTLDEKCNFFHDTLHQLIETCIPITYVEMTDSDKPWVSPLVKLAIQER